MVKTRTRATRLATATAITALACASLGAATPALAAGSPVEAVEQFLEIADRGDFDALDDVVCAAEQVAIREAFDFGAQLGLGGDDALADGLSFDIQDRVVEVVSESGDTAVVSVSAVMLMSVADEDVDDIVRALLEAEQGPDDPPVSDEDVELMSGFMGSALNQTQPIDEELSVVREGGEWLVCSGLFDEPEEPGFDTEPTVSTEAMCGIASPAELSALGPLEYDSAAGFGEFCSFFTSDYDRYHTTSVGLVSDYELESFAAAYGADQPAVVGDFEALATGADAFSNQLLVQVGDDILQVALSIDYDAGTDWLSQAKLIAELLAPRIPATKEAIYGPAPEPTPEPTPQIPLCTSLSLEDLNAATGLGFDDASGDSLYCGYTSIDGDPGFHNVTVSLAESRLDDFRTWLPEATDATLAGQPALLTEYQVVVELEGGAYVASISGFVDPSDETATIDSTEMMALVAELLVPAIDVPEPTISAEDRAALDALQAELDALAQAPIAGLSGPLCDYVDLDAINALGILEYNEVSSMYAGQCAVAQTASEQQFHTVTVLADAGGLEELSATYPDGTEFTVAGRPAFLIGSDLYVETPVGTFGFFVLLPDQAIVDGLEPGDVGIPIAELVIAAIEAEAG